MTDNERIAKFMGVEKAGNWYKISFIHDVTAEDLKYDKLWDWLMPVVEKIENMEHRNMHTFKVDIINRTSVEITAGDKSIYFSEHWDSKNKLEAVYKAVVEFIKWFETRGAEE